MTWQLKTLFSKVVSRQYRYCNIVCVCVSLGRASLHSRSKVFVLIIFSGWLTVMSCDVTPGPTWCFLNTGSHAETIWQPNSHFHTICNYHTFQNGRNFIHPIQRLNRLIMLSEIFECFYFWFPSPFKTLSKQHVFSQIVGNDRWWSWTTQGVWMHPPDHQSNGVWCRRGWWLPHTQWSK